jgi:hypothetical protein
VEFDSVRLYLSSVSPTDCLLAGGSDGPPCLAGGLFDVPFRQLVSASRRIYRDSRCVGGFSAPAARTYGASGKSSLDVRGVPIGMA